MADLPFHSASAWPEELAKAIYEAGKDALADKLGTFTNSLELTNALIKHGARGLVHDKFGPEAQRVLSLKDRDNAPPEVTKVVECVRQHVLADFGEGPDHKAVVETIVKAAHEAMDRKPIEKVQEKFANASLSPEEAAERLLKEAEREVVRKEMADKDLERGVKGSGVEQDSLASTVQSVIDRANHPNPPPAVVEAKAVLAAQIEAARSKAPVPKPAAAEGAAAEE